jgi:hypothetical protein
MCAEYAPGMVLPLRGYTPRVSPRVATRSVYIGARLAVNSPENHLTFPPPRLMVGSVKGGDIGWHKSR